MYTGRRKIQKDKDVEPTEFEETVAQVFCCENVIVPINCFYHLTSPMVNPTCIK